MNAPDSIAQYDTMSRAAKIVANRRALALLLKHHGNRPPEAGCSAEALAIRAQLLHRGGAGRSGGGRRTARPAMPATDRTLAKAGIEEIADRVAARYGVSRSEMVASHVHMSTGADATRAFQEACWRAIDAGASVSAVARVLGRDRAAIRYSARRYAERVGAGSGR